MTQTMKDAAATTPRFAPLDLDAMAPEQRAAAQALIDGPRGGIRGPFHALLRKPGLADRVRMLGDSVRFESSLPAQLRELAIVVTARFWSARYEWHAHSRLAMELGVARTAIDAIGRGRQPQGLTPDQALVYEVVREVLVAKDISDGTYQAALERWGEATLIELLATVAYFGFVSVILNAVRYPVPAGGEELPQVDS